MMSISRLQNKKMLSIVITKDWEQLCAIFHIFICKKFFLKIGQNNCHEGPERLVTIVDTFVMLFLLKIEKNYCLCFFPVGHVCLPWSHVWSREVLREFPSGIWMLVKEIDLCDSTSHKPLRFFYCFVWFLRFWKLPDSFKIHVNQEEAACSAVTMLGRGDFCFSLHFYSSPPFLLCSDFELEVWLK